MKPKKAPSLDGGRKDSSARVSRSISGRVAPVPLIESTPAVMPIFSQASRQAIEQRAHQIWIQEGRPDGRADTHWLQAERELLS
jgi:hypothetical protein